MDFFLYLQMQKILFLLLSVFLFTSACKKKKDCPENTKQAPQSEITALKDYLDANSIYYRADSRGFFYVITDSTNGSKPSTCDNITISYKGSLLNGTVFDQNNSATFTLSNLIAGWQQCLPLIGIGGKITVYIPPTLGYGSSATGSIPANSNLKFEIGLLSF